MYIICISIHLSILENLYFKYNMSSLIVTIIVLRQKSVSASTALMLSILLSGNIIQCKTN